MPIKWPDLCKKRKIPEFLEKMRREGNPEEWASLQRQILLEPPDSAGPLYQKLLPADYEPGTFRISEREGCPSFLYESERSLGFDEWLLSVVQSDLERILPILQGRGISIPAAPEEIGRDIQSILTFERPPIPPLARQIWNQEYSDIIRRLELMLLTGDPDLDLDLYAEVNQRATELGMELIRRFEKRPGTTLREWCLLSVATGLVGLNEKSSMDATSQFYRVSEIPLNISESAARNAERIYPRLEDMVTRKHLLDDSQLFLDDILRQRSRNLTLAVFPDDYLETVFLLKFYELLLVKQPRLAVHFFPKSCRCGNDATAEDIASMFKFPLFEGLRRASNEGRFVSHPDGPAIGGLNLMKLPATAIRKLLDADALDIRGCRAFEMAQGIRKPAVFSFNVIREISESITGLDGESRHMVFIVQNRGEKSFSGFRNRCHREILSSSGRPFMVVPHTVMDYRSRRNRLEITEE